MHPRGFRYQEYGTREQRVSRFPFLVSGAVEWDLGMNNQTGMIMSVLPSMNHSMLVNVRSDDDDDLMLPSVYDSF